MLNRLTQIPSSFLFFSPFPFLPPPRQYPHYQIVLSFIEFFTSLNSLLFFLFWPYDPLLTKYFPSPIISPLSFPFLHLHQGLEFPSPNIPTPFSVLHSLFLLFNNYCPSSKIYSLYLLHSFLRLQILIP